MAQSTVFVNNRSQAVRLPAEVRFPDSVKKVDVRVVGNSRVITPVGASWEDYFLKGPTVTDDFMAERVDHRLKSGVVLRSAPMLKYLLDTSIAIYVMRQTPVHVLGTFRENASSMALSSITVAELLFGAEKSNATARNLLSVEEFCSQLVVLDYGWKAAAHYGSVRARLERAGTPIGNNDLHIAAHARSEGLTLVSNNLREFERVPGLLTTNWLAVS